MSGSSNFKVFNEDKTNIMSDTNYEASEWRKKGNQAGIAPADVYNKLFYQDSIFIAAFAEAMSDAGQTLSDADFATLKAELAKQVCTGGTGYIKFGNGIVIQAASTSSWTTGVSIAEASITWPVAFKDLTYTVAPMTSISSGSFPMIISEKNAARSTSGTTFYLQRCDQATSTSSPAMTIAAKAIGWWK